MIQSVKFDSSNMDIKKLANSTLIFIIKRLIEIIGILFLIIGILILISLISYSPSDPNFIFPENTEIKNLLGFQGSYVADIFFQSVGLISYLISLTLIFTGINVFRQKKIILIIQNLFYSTLYSIFGTYFLSSFYNNSFDLYINGSGGFVGSYFVKTLSPNFISSYENIILNLLTH